MKKLLTANIVLLGLIICSVFTVFADSGNNSINIPFIVIVSVLAPLLVALIVYYALRAKKVKNAEKKESETKIIRDYDDK